MFEGSNNGSAFLGVAIANNQAAKNAQKDATSAKRGMLQIADIALDLREQLDAATARVAQLEDALAVEKAHTEGLDAMARALIAQHPDSPLRGDSGKRYKDGKIKLKTALIYEAAHDACLTKLLGISNPASRRAD